MANFFERLFGVEQRAAAPTAPPRLSATYVTPEKALTLTPVYRATQILATPISKMYINDGKHPAPFPSAIVVFQ